jgi:hypothetical protein
MAELRARRRGEALLTNRSEQKQLETEPKASVSLFFFLFRQTEISEGGDPNEHTDSPEMNSSAAVRHNFKYWGGGGSTIGGGALR